MNERQRKAKEAKEKFVSDIKERRKEIASGKSGDKYLTKKQKARGMKELPRSHARHQEAFLQDKEYDEIRDEIVPKGTMSQRIKADPITYKKYVSGNNPEYPEQLTEPTFLQGTKARTE